MAIAGNKIFFEFDPFELAGVEKPKTNIREARQRIADLVLDEVLTYVGQSKSPVAGEGWKASLSKSYRKQKSKFSSTLRANMELHGDMLDALECIVNPRGMLELRVTGTDEAAKADGHNNHSGMSSLPQRRFIPDDEQTFKREIIQKMKVIASEYLDAQGKDAEEDGEE